VAQSTRAPRMMELQQTRYELRTGEPVRISATSDTLDFLLKAKTRSIEFAGKRADGLVVGPNRQGDLVLAANTDTPPSLTLRVPHNEVRGRIMSVIDGVRLIGQYDVVIINRGKDDGVDAGDVLAIDNIGGWVRDAGDGSSSEYGFGHGSLEKLPNERAGTMLLFKSFDHMSYGLVVGEAYPARVADIVRNP